MVEKVTIKGYKSFKELNLKLAGLIQSAKQRGTQIIIATQSSDLISLFEPEDVITVTQTDGVTSMERMRQCCPHFNEWVSEMEKV